MRGFLGSLIGETQRPHHGTPGISSCFDAIIFKSANRPRFKSEGMLRSKAGLSGHSSMTIRDGLPGIASEEAESKALLLDNAHLLSRTDLGDLALARGLRLRLLF